MAGLFWSFVWTFIGFGFIIASLSEMASMYDDPKSLFGILFCTHLIIGHQPPADNITGSLSFPRLDIKDSLAILQVKFLLFPT
jgi:hypothetical protein